jgi:branched-chain amino acid transport system substrate-binding protein
VRLHWCCSAAENLLYPYSYDQDSGEPRERGFCGTYQKRFGRMPDPSAANSYDAASLPAGCLEEAGDRPAEVKACLYRVRDCRGASGVFSINADGDAIKELLIKTVHGGVFVRY